MDDTEIVRQILNGDAEAGERLVAQHYAPIFRWLRYLTGCPELAQDLTQQTFVNAWRGLASYEGRASLTTWLHRIAHHTYTHWLRAIRPTLNLDAAGAVFDLQADRQMQDALDAAVEGVLLHNALLQLSEEHRLTFFLRYVQELSVAEVASVLSIPEGTVLSRCHFARERLRRLLQETFPAADPNTCVVPLPSQSAPAAKNPRPRGIF